jgi:hypothetical protein
LQRINHFHRERQQMEVELRWRVAFKCILHGIKLHKSHQRFLEHSASVLFQRTCTKKMVCPKLVLVGQDDSQLEQYGPIKSILASRLADYLLDLEMLELDQVRQGDCILYLVNGNRWQDTLDQARLARAQSLGKVLILVLFHGSDPTLLADHQESDPRCCGWFLCNKYFVTEQPGTLNNIIAAFDLQSYLSLSNLAATFACALF